MSDKIRQFILSFNEVDPPSHLFYKIMDRVDIEKKIISIRRNIFVVSLFMVFSAIGVFFSLQAANWEFATSNTFEFLSLIASDFDAVIAYWDNFFLAFLESLPYLTIAMILVFFAALLESLKIMMINLRNFWEIKTFQHS